MDNAECPLAELVDDPLIGPVMKSDGVDRRELKLVRVGRSLNPCVDRPRERAIPPTRRNVFTCN